jgi:hypothetical protein
MQFAKHELPSTLLPEIPELRLQTPVSPPFLPSLALLLEQSLRERFHPQCLSTLVLFDKFGSLCGTWHD